MKKNTDVMNFMFFYSGTLRYLIGWEAFQSIIYESGANKFYIQHIYLLPMVLWSWQRTLGYQAVSLLPSYRGYHQHMTKGSCY
jgi:hypothetical protein